ncbi:hypothetical protein TSA1_06550 [Bradyrhizobium nitroreducens]|uniref:Uncharacterized protein n=1 Tax=Bradyrhizobium nitroreducens TaxID=709803 RepID=A0A2M6U794_9BRAD|nr:hypothetical protein TSA1_06550 [Bradyrhizobium nitroreducens]
MFQLIEGPQRRFSDLECGSSQQMNGDTENFALNCFIAEVSQSSVRWKQSFMVSLPKVGLLRLASRHPSALSIMQPIWFEGT